MARRQPRGGEEEGGGGVDSKARLVQEIFSAGSIFSSCPHRRRPSRSPPFVDWFLLLGVDVDEKVDVIGKRYRQLALQLHPDKNKHPKADVAFKLVSEAYACLSDKAKRKAFDSERRSNFCRECYDRYTSTINVAHKQRRQAPSSSSSSGSSCSRVMSTLRQLQKMLRDECEVIEGCLRANGGAYWKDSPLFNPCEQGGPSSSGYSYFRRTPGRAPMMNRCRSGGNYDRDRCCGRGICCESPVYEMGKKAFPRSNNVYFRF